MRPAITEADLLEQVQNALDFASDPEGAVSTKELSEALNIPAEKVRTRLRKLIEQNVVEVVKVPRTNIVGVVQHQFCYRLVQNPEENP